MTPRPPVFESRFIDKPALISFALIAFVLWIGRYWYAGEFGLYEDDHFRLTVTMNWPWGRLLGFVRGIAFNGNVGRMLHEVLIYVLGKACWDLGGVTAMHLLGACILYLNSVLFYLLLRRLEFPRAAAIFGALVFVLFPADTTQVFLTHALGIHPGMTCLLVSAHLFLAGRWLLALLVVVPCLFIYESLYLLFFGVPLLALASERIRWMWAAVYAGMAAAIFGFLTYLRIVAGDDRSTRAAEEFGKILPVIWRNVSTGPFQCLKWVFALPGEAAPDLLLRAPFFLAVTLLSGYALWWLWRKDEPEAIAGAEDGSPWHSLPLRYAGVSVVLLFLSYPLLFEMDPAVLVGRNSRVHLAAVVGASILLASVVWLLQRKLIGPNLSVLSTGILAVFCGMMTLSALRVQDDYRLVWTYQRAFWTDILRQSPDIAPGTLLLVPMNDLDQHIGFWPWAWEHTRIASSFYRFPGDQTPPRLFFMRRDWEGWVKGSGNLLDGVDPTIFSRRVIDEHQGKPVHFYHAFDGHLRRLEGPLHGGGHEFEITPPPPAGTQPSYEKTRLFDLFVRPEGAPPVNYLAEVGK